MAYYVDGQIVLGPRGNPAAPGTTGTYYGDTNPISTYVPFPTTGTGPTGNDSNNGDPSASPAENQNYAPALPEIPSMPPNINPSSMPTREFPKFESRLFPTLLDELLNPSFTVTAPQQALIDAATRQSKGMAALRGLVPTQAQIQQVSLPLLEDFQRQRVADLTQGFNVEAQTFLQERNQNINSFLGQLNSMIEQRGQNVNNVADLLEYNLGNRGLQVQERGQDLQALLQMLLGLYQGQQ